MSRRILVDVSLIMVVPGFRRWRALHALLLTAVLAAAVVAPISAAEAAEASTTTAPPTTAPPTTAPPTTAPPTTAAPTTAAPTTSPSTTAGGGTAPSTTVDPNAETTTTTIDPNNPLEGEDPNETVPPGTVVVPPRTGGYANQPGYKAPRVLWGNVRVAEVKLADAEASHRQAVSQVKSTRLRIKELDAAVAQLDEETIETLAALAIAESRLEERALSAFVRGDAIAVSPSLDHDDILESMAQQTMVESIFNQDKAAITAYQSLRDSLDVETEATYQRLKLLDSIQTSSITAVGEERAMIRQAEIELRAFQAGSEIFIDGLVFPVGDGVELPLIDSFGFARMTGTPDEHWHEGIDIFAPTGTPLVATERGVVTNVGSGRLGGARFWLRGESGTDWYYAHLSGFAPGLEDGLVVEAGDLLGYVGSSGNAVGSPPHVHMQMHPDGGRPVNPYPLLATVLEIDQEEALAAQR